MSIDDYLSAVKQHLVSDPVVSEFHVIRQRESVVDGHIRVRTVLRDDSRLEFSEYLQRLPAGDIVVVTYSYHWADGQNNLIKRWDNTPHFPNLPNHPHHIHDGISGKTMAGQPTDIFKVLDEIAKSLT